MICATAASGGRECVVQDGASMGLSVRMRSGTSVGGEARIGIAATPCEHISINL